MAMDKYAQKEKQILEALLQIAAEGNDISEITVQDIATAANIGKGTIYEYFSSKEEIFEKAIFYIGYTLISKICFAVENAETFDQKLNTLEAELMSVGKDTLNIHKTLIEALGFPKKIDTQEPPHARKVPIGCLERLDQMFENMLWQAYTENIIDSDLPKDYTLFVLRTITASFFELVHIPDLPPDDIPNIVSHTNRMLYKSLS